MKKSIKNNQSGIAHLGLILLITAVLSVVGIVGYRVYQNNQEVDDEFNTELIEIDSAENTVQVSEQESDDELAEIEGMSEANDEN